MSWLARAQLRPGPPQEPTRRRRAPSAHAFSGRAVGAPEKLAGPRTNSFAAAAAPPYRDRSCWSTWRASAGRPSTLRAAPGGRAPRRGSTCTKLASPGRPCAIRAEMMRVGGLCDCAEYDCRPLSEAPRRSTGALARSRRARQLASGLSSGRRWDHNFTISSTG